MTAACRMLILIARNGFIRGHCGKVAPKAPSDRETGASAQAAIHLLPRAALSCLPLFTNGRPLRVCPSSQATACQRASTARQWPGHRLVVLIFHYPRACPAYLKRRCIHTQSTPVSGHVGLHGAHFPPGKTRVASDQASSGRSGVVPHDRSAPADLSATAAKEVRNTHLKARTL